MPLKCHLQKVVILFRIYKVSRVSLAGRKHRISSEIWTESITICIRRLHVYRLWLSSSFVFLLTFVFKSSITNMPVLLRVLVKGITGDKPLSETMMVQMRFKDFHFLFENKMKYLLETYLGFGWLNVLVNGKFCFHLHRMWLSRKHYRLVCIERTPVTRRISSSGNAVMVIGLIVPWKIWQ